MAAAAPLWIRVLLATAGIASDTMQTLHLAINGIER